MSDKKLIEFDDYSRRVNRFYTEKRKHEVQELAERSEQYRKMVMDNRIHDEYREMMERRKREKGEANDKSRSEGTTAKLSENGT